MPQLSQNKITLTKRQNDVFRFLKDYRQRHGFPPTIQEICQHFGFASTNGVSQILNALERKGHIIRQKSHDGKTKSRGIFFADENKTNTLSENNIPTHVKKIAVIGHGNAIQPLDVFLSPEATVFVDTGFLGNTSSKNQIFASRVRDNGLSSSGIFENDIVVVKQTSDPKNGQIVVALVDEMNIVRVYSKQGDTIELSATTKGFPKHKTKNNDHSTAILGIVIGLLRSFSN